MASWPRSSRHFAAEEDPLRWWVDVYARMLEAYTDTITPHVEVLNDVGSRTERFFVSDGRASSRIWMGIVADGLQQPVRRLPGHPESRLAAAFTASVGVGSVEDWEGAARFVEVGEIIALDPAYARVYAATYRRFPMLHRPT